MRFSPEEGCVEDGFHTSWRLQQEGNVDVK